MRAENGNKRGQPVHRGLRYRLTELFDLPKDLVLDLPRITALGHLQAAVENHRGLEKYSRKRVVVRVRDGRVDIRGERLVIGRIDSSVVVVTGEFSEIRFERNRSG